MKKAVGIDIDNDGKPDLHFDIKTLILVIGGIISITMTYTTLTKQIEINKQQIEVAKKLPPLESHDILEQKILFLEQFIKSESNRLDKIEDKIYKR
jgi:hypothetical protein|tara:strand:- start:1586 stop:1873 length:288 start_codon:yes stop_codon:yes gene_type:complete